LKSASEFALNLILYFVTFSAAFYSFGHFARRPFKIVYQPAATCDAARVAFICTFVFATGFGFVLGLRRREQLNINASREDCPSTYAYLNK